MGCGDAAHSRQPPHGQASCEAASIRSFARSRRRKSSGSWLAGASLSRTGPLPLARDTPGLVTTQSPPSARSFWSHGYNFPQKTARLPAPLPRATRNQRDKTTVFVPYHFSACRPAGNVLKRCDDAGGPMDRGHGLVRASIFGPLDRPLPEYCAASPVARPEGHCKGSPT